MCDTLFQYRVICPSEEFADNNICLDNSIDVYGTSYKKCIDNYCQMKQETAGAVAVANSY